MPSLASDVPPAAAPGPAGDQASGLRRLFASAAPHCTLVLTPAMRAPAQSQALARRLQAGAAIEGPTLVIDAARSQVALALDLKLRYDLEHALAGDCSLADACASAGPELRILPAARALDNAMADERHARRLAACVEALARDFKRLVLILPAARVAWVRHLAADLRPGAALIPVANGGETSAAVLTAVRQAMGEAQIDTFHLLFLGMGEAAAGRLLSGMAAIAQRHFGARLLAAPSPAEAARAPTRADAAHRSVESVF